MWPGLGVYFLLVAIRVTINYLSLRNYVRLPLVERVDIAADLPSVSIVVPARDEERNLPALLTSLAALQYPRTEVIVVDDASSDRTAEIARKHGARLIQVDGPEAGWTGKAYACWRGAQVATGEWLLFTDADTTHEPASLQRTVSYALAHSLQALSLFVQQRCVTFWERVLLPFAYQQYFISVPYRRVNVPRDPAALANGQYILVRRDSYFQLGGHQAVRSSVTDDVALARHFKSQGMVLYVARAERQASVRMYHGLGEIWRGFAKNTAGFLRQRGPAASLTVLGVLLSGLAIPCAIYGLAIHSFGFEMAAFVTYVAAVMELSLWQFLFGTQLVWAVFQPLAAVTFAIIALDGLLRRKHAWKGRVV